MNKQSFIENLTDEDFQDTSKDIHSDVENKHTSLIFHIDEDREIMY